MRFLENMRIQKILVLILALAGGYIIYLKSEDLSQWPQWASGHTFIQWLFFSFGLLALMVLNWVFDSWGWHLLTYPFRGQSWGKAWRENLYAQGLGWLTPASLGEYYAKGKGFSSAKWGIGLTLIYRWNKLGTKTVLGILALGFATGHPLMIFMGGLGLCVLYMTPAPIFRWFLLKLKNISHIETKEALNTPLPWWKMVSSGILKSITYALQFTWIVLWMNFQYVEPVGDFLFFAYGLAFFGLSGWIPSASWADPLIKSGVGILLIPESILPRAAIVFISLILWITNVLLPTLPGLLQRGRATLLK